MPEGDARMKTLTLKFTVAVLDGRKIFILNHIANTDGHLFEPAAHMNEGDHLNVEREFSPRDLEFLAPATDETGRPIILAKSA
jgi:hypothetical protein